ncbi:MAG TPA: hypothetical protein VEA19_00800, partial [Actinomycetota bacterium]|nr:hypothetical protein [Actinomycetota bacterium]
MRRFVLALLTLPIALSGLPGTAQEGPEILTSENVELLHTMPEATLASSVVFDPDKPVMYISTWKGLEVWDITNPVLPVPLGVEVLLGHQNEAMTFGKRADGSRFVLFASNSA